MDVAVCYECGEEIPVDEVYLGKDKVPGTEVYQELCSLCFDKEDV